ncbi:MAG: Co2+/Mg2+ efflux protein ApaG [Gammaproteobacteria bacterium]|nr:Co2+/Mg2+ efflux protein ApaG [Gammaproteobacteria bacterium]
MNDKHLEDTLRIEVFTKYDKQKSVPEKDQYVFFYAVGITNLCDEDMQVIGRKWTITDGNNESHEVKGEGIVGSKPVIEPNHSFAYTSGVMLDTEMGTMEGEYRVRDSDGCEFNVPIDKFTLSIPRIIN